MSSAPSPSKRNGTLATAAVSHLQSNGITNVDITNVEHTLRLLNAKLPRHAASPEPRSVAVHSIDATKDETRNRNSDATRRTNSYGNNNNNNLNNNSKSKKKPGKHEIPANNKQAHGGKNGAYEGAREESKEAALQQRRTRSVHSDEGSRGGSSRLGGREREILPPGKGAMAPVVKDTVSFRAKIRACVAFYI
jgi:hypothetical protein